MLIGQKIKNYIKLKGITQEELANKIGVSRNYTTINLSKDRVTNEFLKKVTTALNLPEGYFNESTEKVVQVANNNTNSTISQQIGKHDQEFSEVWKALFKMQAEINEIKEKL